jgi:hypothetical protein
MMTYGWAEVGLWWLLMSNVDTRRELEPLHPRGNSHGFPFSWVGTRVGLNCQEKGNIIFFTANRTTIRRLSSSLPDFYIDYIFIPAVFLYWPCFSGSSSLNFANSNPQIFWRCVLKEYVVRAIPGADKFLARPTSLSIVFSVQGTGGSPTGSDPENRVVDQDIGIPVKPVSSGLQVPGEPFPSWSG